MSPRRFGGRGLLVKNTAFNVVGQVLPMLVGIFAVPPIVHGLGAEGYGLLSVAWMVLGYFGIFDLGLSRATVKLVAEYLQPSKIHKVPELIWTSVLILSLMGTVVGSIAAILTPFGVSRVLSVPPQFVPEAKAALLILSCGLPVILVNDAMRGVLEAGQRFDLVNIVKIPASILFYLAAVLMIPFGVRVPGIVAAMVVIRFLSTIAYFAMSLRMIPQLRSSFRCSWIAAKLLTHFGGWVMVSTIIGPIFGYMERFLVASVLPIGMLAYYSVPFDLVGKVLIFPASLAPALFPYFSHHGTENAGEVSDVTTASVKYLSFVLFPVTVIIFGFAGDVLRIWMGPVYAERSTVVLKILAITLLLNSLGYIPYSSVQAMGRPELKAILDAVALPAYALYCWWLLHRFGINGAATAKLISTIIDTGFLYVFAWKLKAFSPRALIRGPAGRALSIGGLLGVAVFCVTRTHAGFPLTLAVAGACCGAYGILCWHLATAPGERASIRSLWQQP